MKTIKIFDWTFNELSKMAKDNDTNIEEMVNDLLHK